MTAPLAASPAVSVVEAADPVIPRYTRTAQVLHWLTAALAVAVLPLAWVAVSLAREEPARPVMFQLHKSVGITLFALVAIRILWRLFNPPPPEVTEPTGLAFVAKVSHWLLYAIFLIMPVTGFLLSAYNGSTTQFFYLFPIPGFAKDKALHDAFENAHVAGQWAVYALVLLHILATAWHVAIRRDYVLDRMLPAQDPGKLRPR